VGDGSIGTPLSVLAESLGMQALFHDEVAQPPLGGARQVGKLGDLLAQAEVLSLHVPQRPDTDCLMGEVIDVFPVEPGNNEEVFISPWRGLDNALLTPHIGGSTPKAQARIGLALADKLVRYSDNGATTGSVNLPEVALPSHPGQHRLLHIHRNVPGVLSALDQVCGARHIHIAAHHLQTRGNIGDAVTDIDTPCPEQALHEAAQVPGTLRIRMLC
jgi:D-3-phosphoglycerate dehydrogenase